MHRYEYNFKKKHKVDFTDRPTIETEIDCIIKYDNVI